MQQETRTHSNVRNDKYFVVDINRCQLKSDTPKVPLLPSDFPSCPPFDKDTSIHLMLVLLVGKYRFPLNDYWAPEYPIEKRCIFYSDMLYTYTQSG